MKSSDLWVLGHQFIDMQSWKSPQNLPGFSWPFFTCKDTYKQLDKGDSNGAYPHTSAFLQNSVL